MLGDLFEPELHKFIGGPKEYFVKMGRECRLEVMECIKGVKDDILRLGHSYSKVVWSILTGP
jgi:hypothetical protein